jgi:serine/threonine protein kinase/type II secretory pathway pseudopilin PulG
MNATTYGDDPRVAELLRRWEELCQEGRSVTAEELCSTCPELAGELARRIGRSGRMAALLDDKTDADREQARDSATCPAYRPSATARAEFHDLRFHAAGALGEVFMARNAELNREVALKFIKPERASEAESLRRFLQEAEVTGRLEHPGVVPIYGLGTDANGSPCYAMRFIRGTTLQDAIDVFHAAEKPGRDDSERSLALRSLLNRYASVCSTVAYAHSRGILHRDLKPRNIMLGNYDETLVVDWGLAKPFDRDEAARSAGEETLMPSSGSGSGSDTPTVGVVGTPAYMSPEQAEARWDLVGPASDIFGLGGILYAILTGQPPYQGRKIGEMLEKVKRCEYRKPRELKSGVPRALEAICLKALARRPEDRYATALDVAEDVRRWLADEPVAAWREPVLIRVRRWMRRHRTGVAAAVVALLAGVAALGIVAGVQARANRQLRLASAATMRALEQAQNAQAQTQAALAQSEASRKQAEESHQQAEAVTNFLVDAFRSPDPSQTGRDVKVVDVLDKAAEKLEKEFTGTAPTKGALLHALGLTYQGLGLYDRAISLHAKARNVREAALGPDDPDTLKSANSLAVDYWHAGRLSEAIALHEATLRIRESKLGPDHPDTLISRNNLAIAYHNAGRLDAAIKLDEATLKLFEAKLGPDDPHTLGSRNNLAVRYWSAGRLAEAITLDEATLKLKESKLGPDHPDTLTSRNNLAIRYRFAGRLAEAITLLDLTLKTRESKLGPDHPDTLMSRSNLANAYRDAGRLAEAISLDDATLKLRAAKLGPNHPDTLMSRSNLAVSYWSAGRLAEAIRLDETTLKLYESELGPNHPDTFRSNNNLASDYEALGRFPEAEALYRRTLSGRRKTNKPDSPFLADDLASLGHFLLERSRWSEAEPLLREALAIRAKAARDDWEHYDAMSLLGSALLGQVRFAEAEALIVSGYEGMKAREARIYVPDRPRLLEAAERVVRLYEEWAKPDQAAAWKIKLGLPDLPRDVFAKSG